MRLLNGDTVKPTIKGIAKVEAIDLAWCLGAVVKFNGASPASYSYAQSAVNLAELLKKKGYSRDAMKWALLSPAWVLFFGTVSEDLLELHPELEAVIYDVHRVIYDRFHIGNYKPSGDILEISHALFDAEKANFFGLPDFVEASTDEILKETKFEFARVLSTPDAMALWLQYWNGLEDQVGG
ncbi:MAG: hypothetical protein V7776_05195 [Halopseudomonas aestusnigri]